MIDVGFWWETHTDACCGCQIVAILERSNDNGWQHGEGGGRGFVSHHSFWAIEGLVGSGEILGGPRPLGPSATCPHVRPPFVLLT